MTVKTMSPKHPVWFHASTSAGLRPLEEGGEHRGQFMQVDTGTFDWFGQVRVRQGFEYHQGRCCSTIR